MSLTNDQTKRVLTEAKALIERGWVQGAFAVDAEGNAVSETDERACAWCVIGAINKSANDLGLYQTPPLQAMDATLGSREGIDSWNDAELRTQDEVIAAFDKAIATLS